MKKFKNLTSTGVKILFLIFAFTSITMQSISQMPAAITIEPPDATAYDELTLTFDPDSACFQSGSLAGLDSIAMHSGVTFEDGSQWNYCVNFNSVGANGQSTTLLPTGDGRFSITYTPSEFYGLNGEIVVQICAVFNNGTNWNQDGRDFVQGGPDCMDFFIALNFESPGQIIYIPWEYPTIQEGIDAAVDGDTVLVNTGWYPENINFLGKNITVASRYIFTQNANYIDLTEIDGSQIGTVVTFDNEEDSTAVLCGFTISNGNSTSDGGGIYCEGSGPIICNCHIIYNSAVDGGGISCQYGAYPQISDCDVKWNHATLDGGGIYHEEDCNTTISNCLLYNNYGDDEGAGIYYETNCTSLLLNCQILNNSAGIYGGGICCYGSNIKLENSDIYNNYAYFMGGGILADHADLIVENTNFVGNEAPGHGGAFFYENPPGNPGEFEISFLNCSFENNTTDGACGGLLISKEEGDESIIDVKLDNCTFSGNSADRRSGMNIRGEDVSFNISNCIFDNNTATTYAAGISLSKYCQGGLINCLFASNHADTGGEDWNSGGASVWSEANVDIINCTFVDNTAAYGAGLTVGGGGIANSLNCIYWGNSNGQIALDTYDNLGGNLTIEYCDVQYGNDSVNISPESTLNWGDGNINAAPLFIGSGQFPFSLQDGSPCVNTGIPDTTGLNLPELDLAGNPRVFGGRIEMGAYENQNVVVGTKYMPSLGSIQFKAYPNPFSNKTTIEYSLYNQDLVLLEIFDIKGQKITTLVNEKQHAGKYQIEFDAAGLPAGIYFYSLKTSQGKQTGKMVLMR